MSRVSRISWASWVRRVLLFVLAIVVPITGLGFALGGMRGLVGLGALAWVFLFAVVLTAERGILRAYQVRPQTPDGSRRSLERVVAVLGGRAPKIFSFSDPSRQALVVRSPGGSGTILLSEGLLGSLSEQELRSLLTACVLRLRSRGIRLQSACAWLAHLVLELAPRPWVELVFGELRWHEALGVFGALRFSMVFSVAKFFLDLGQIPRDDVPTFGAQLPVMSGEISNPGSCILHFWNPWASRALIPLVSVR